MQACTKHWILNGFELKQCSRCHQWLFLRDFYQTHTRSDGLTSQCKECYAIWTRAHRELTAANTHAWRVA